jgi:transcriptional regulator with XRE-family HTH domain
MTFGETLKRIRASKGLPQREVARRIPMDYSRFSRLENDRTGFNPTRETVEKIARALGAGPEEHGELLAAAGRLDREIESLASVASENPAIGRLLRIAADLPPEKLEILLSYAETNFGASPKAGRKRQGKSTGPTKAPSQRKTGR